jgi:hypothetical protein
MQHNFAGLDLGDYFLAMIAVAHSGIQIKDFVLGGDQS